MAWRRSVDRALSPLKITTAEWLLLEATRELIRTTRDAVSQNDIAASAGVDRTTVSRLMKVLERKGFVSRGPDLSARGYRIWLHGKGEHWAKLGSSIVEAVSVNWLNPLDPLGVRR
jgi:DNA-binding MarR family transcriptional regulator